MALTKLNNQAIASLTDFNISHDDMPSGSVLQVVKLQNTTTYTSANSVSLGSSGGGANAPTSTQGVSLGTVSFTPKQAGSKLLIQSTNIAMSETSNVADNFWVSAFVSGSRITWNSATLGHSQGLNKAFPALNDYVDCPSNSTFTIDFRAGSTGSNGAYYQINDNYNSSWVVSPIVFTITEIAQ